MDLAFYDIIGFAGVAIALGAYFANQQRWLPSDDWRFPATNLLGAALIFISLCFEWNFPSAVIEVCWGLISIWGIFKALRERRTA